MSTLHEAPTLARRTWLQWLLRPWTMIGLLCLFLILLSPFVFRAWRLSMVLNTKGFDPQPLIAESLKITPANNAATDFRIAITKKKSNTSYTEPTFENAISYSTSEIQEPYLTWLNDNQAALDAWIAGVPKEYFAEFELQNVTYSVLLPLVQESRDFTRLMLLKAKQEYIQGNMKEALDWHRNSFRSGLLVGKQGMLIEKLVSIASLYLLMQKGIIPLIADDHFDEKELRDLQTQLQADHNQLNSPASVIFKTEAILFHNTLKDCTATQLLSDYSSISTGGVPDSLLNVGLYFAAEPQISAKLHRQVMANLLTECDLPPYQRTIVKGTYYDLYAISPKTSSPGMMTPKDINRVVEHSLFQNLAPTFNQFQTAVDRFDAKWAAFNAAFLLEIHRRRHGSYPSALSDLDADLSRELPIDPFTGKPLILKSIPNGTLLIYSLGDNLIDDGGIFRNHEDSGFQLGTPQILVQPKSE